MKIFHRVLYLPRSAGLDTPANWWTAWNFAIAVKEGTINGYFEMTVGGVKTRIDKTNCHLARERFCVWMQKKAEDELGTKDFIIVPVPSSDAVVGSAETPRCIRMLSGGLSKEDFKKIREAVRFTELLEKASNGGPRFADELYPKMKVILKPEKKLVVLVDDIMTSGGHMKATRKMLSEAGWDVRLGIVCGRKVGTTNLDPLAEGSIEISDDLSRVTDLKF